MLSHEIFNTSCCQCGQEQILRKVEFLFVDQQFVLQSKLQRRGRKTQLGRNCLSDSPTIKYRCLLFFFCKMSAFYMKIGKIINSNVLFPATRILLIESNTYKTTRIPSKTVLDCEVKHCIYVVPYIDNVHICNVYI